MAVRRKVRSPWLWSCLLLALIPALSRGQEKSPPAASKPEPKPVELPARVAYLQALEKFWKGGGGTLQSVYALARAAAQEELNAVIAWDEALAAGKIPKNKFERTLPGFHVGTGDALYVVPNSRFFLELANQRGNDVDRRFFTLLDLTLHGSISRIYVSQITDTTACYEPGSREFIALYGGWTQFKASAPKAYVEPVQEEFQIMDQTLLTANCACGSQEIVASGLEAFLKTFPKSPVASQVRTRLDKVRAGTSGIQFKCGHEVDLGQALPHGVQTPPQ